MPGFDRITIGEAARRLGVSTATLRLYERWGLLPPSQRTAAGYRQFSHEDLRRVRLIRSARRAGLSLRQVGQLLSGPSDEARLLQCLRQHLAQLEREGRRNAVLQRHLSRWLRGR
jgi:DNA-binding transcriptional MerR regulator